MNGGPGLRSTGLQPLTPVNPAAHRTRSETRAPTSQPVELAAIDAGEWAEPCTVFQFFFAIVASADSFRAATPAVPGGFYTRSRPQ